MSDRYTDLISDYLDGTLDPGTHRQVERHLAGCTECAALLADFERVVGRARVLAEDDTPPAEDLWPGIEARLRRAAQTPLPIPVTLTAVPERRSLKPRISFTLPQLAAACLAVVALSAAGAFYIGGGARKAETTAPVAQQLPAPAAATMTESQDAIKDVERLKEILASRRNELDPATVAALEGSLRAIDMAIRQGQLALAADPKNPYLRDHLDDTMRRKVDLMRRATMLASAD
ncbi:MAG TPA: zf-HC2 domain-containing protein [Candidatus Eisenbacteria bacterium]|jgi:anti-sigma factor RsiW|nr:zf-HC2 domain-containing protein [Candidatus Eisenbacteria bacterium]